jgi:hypothetical protein
METLMMNRWSTLKQVRLNKKIQNNWSKLTEEEITLYQEAPDLFFDIIKKKYSMFRGDAERQINHLKSQRHFFYW